MRLERVNGSLLSLAHELIRARIRCGDTVVDATIGNGHDTLFLTECVGNEGRVIGFDVQTEALEATAKRLLDHEVPEEVFDLHLVGHQHMAMHLPPEISAAVFNLGYLPGSDKTMITETGNTLEALNQSLTCLKVQGILSVMCYPGHEGGGDESDAVIQWFEENDHEFDTSICYQREGGRETSPFLILAEKKAIRSKKNGQPPVEADRQIVDNSET